MSILSRLSAAWSTLKARTTRVWRWWIVGLLLLAIIAVTAPQTLGVLALKVGQQVLAAVIGYHLSKVTLIHAIPEVQRANPLISASLTLGRALVMVGAMLAVGIGL